MKRIEGVIVSGVVLVALAALILGCAPASGTPPSQANGSPEADSYTLKLAAANPVTDPGSRAAMMFAEDVRQMTGGRIDIEVHHSGVLGDWVSVQEEVMKGQIDMSLSPLTGQWDARLEAAIMPFLIHDHYEAYMAFGPNDSYLRDYFDDIAADTSLKLVVGWDGLFNGFAYAPGRLPANWENPTANKNSKARIASSAMREKMAYLYGYTPTVLPWSDCFQALQTGLIDVVIGGPTATAYESFRDVMGDWVQLNELHQVNWLLMHRPLWDELSASDQALLQVAADKISAVSFVEGEAFEQEYLQKMVDYGINVHFPSDTVMKAYTDVTIAELWPWLEERYGPDLIAKLQEYRAAMDAR